MTVRSSNQLVAELIQPFWAAWQAGEFMPDASAIAGIHRRRGLTWVRQAGGVRPRRGCRDPLYLKTSRKVAVDDQPGAGPNRSLTDFEMNIPMNRRCGCHRNDLPVPLRPVPWHAAP